jgi:hypothetical protein
MKKTNEIYKKIQNNPKFEQRVSNNVGWLQKKTETKKTTKKQKNSSPSVSSPSARMRHSGFPEC